ncbi:MAG: hypothetical protein RIS47_238, partial [Bacteroidota bacterium]
FENHLQVWFFGGFSINATIVISYYFVLRLWVKLDNIVISSGCGNPTVYDVMIMIR